MGATLACSGLHKGVVRAWSGVIGRDTPTRPGFEGVKYKPTLHDIIGVSWPIFCCKRSSYVQNTLYVTRTKRIRSTPQSHCEWSTRVWFDLPVGRWTSPIVTWPARPLRRLWLPWRCPQLLQQGRHVSGGGCGGWVSSDLGWVSGDLGWVGRSPDWKPPVRPVSATSGQERDDCHLTAFSRPPRRPRKKQRDMAHTAAAAQRIR